MHILHRDSSLISFYTFLTVIYHIEDYLFLGIYHLLLKINKIRFFFTLLVSNNYKIKYSFLFCITFTNSKTPDDEVKSTKVNYLKSERIAFVERLKTVLS